MSQQVTGPIHDVASYNDSINTTKEDVVRLLRKTAATVDHGLKFQCTFMVYE